VGEDGLKGLAHDGHLVRQAADLGDFLVVADVGHHFLEVQRKVAELAAA
jgi:hypothetical protein